MSHSQIDTPQPRPCLHPVVLLSGCLEIFTTRRRARGMITYQVATFGDIDTGAGFLLASSDIMT